MMTHNKIDQKLDNLVSQALSLPPEERVDFLHAACGNDETLRKKAEILVKGVAGDIPDDFLNDPLPMVPFDEILESITTSESTKPGDLIGKYRLVKRIGKGGMGEVFLAERADGEVDMQVAIKVVRGGFGSEESLERFRYERQILAKLKHPNIATLYDVGITSNGLPYLAMEYLEGKPLDTFCDERKLSVEERLKYFKKVCDAVQHAQNSLVIHRDLKPSNILVTDSGAVKLLDFGIAKFMSNDELPATPDTLDEDTSGSENTIPSPETQLTYHKAPFTPEYAAPEQVDGSSVTTATDVYALGVILYKLLSGERPYSVRGVHTQASLSEFVWSTFPKAPSSHLNTVTRASERVRQEQVSQDRAELKPKSLRRRLRGDLDAITLKALEKLPEDRYASAGELGRDIQRYLDHRPIRARPDNFGLQMGKFIRRHQTTVIASFIGFLILIAGTGATIRESNLRNIEEEGKRLEEQSKQATIAVIANIMELVDPEMPEGYTFTARQIIDKGLERLEDWEAQPLVQAELLNEFGRIVLNAGMLSLADSLHRKALGLQINQVGPSDPLLAESHMRIAEVYERSGDPVNAELQFLTALNLDVNHEKALNNLGVFYIYQSRFLDAQKQFERLTEINPSDARAYRNLGNSYFYMENWDKAKEIYTLSLEKERHYNALSNLATIYYYIEKDYNHAAQLYSDALQLNDQDFWTWSYLGSTLQLIPSLQDSASAALNKSISIAKDYLAKVDSTDPDIHAELASLYASTQNTKMASFHIKKVLNTPLDDNKILYKIGYTYELLGERDSAVQFIDRALKKGYYSLYAYNEPVISELIASPSFLSLQNAN